MLIITAIGTKAQTFTCQVMNQDGPIELRVTIISAEEKAVEIKEVRNKNTIYETLNIPAEVVNYENGETYKVTSIGYNAFSRLSNVTSINIPEGVTTIGDNAFYGCTALTSINIPEGVTDIEERAFEDCTALTSVTIPKSLQFIGAYAFYKCTNIKTVNISDFKAWCQIKFVEKERTEQINSWTQLSANPLFNVTKNERDNRGYWYYEFGEPRDLVLNGEKIVDIVIPSDINYLAGHFFGCSAESLTFEKLNVPADDYQYHTILNNTFAGMKNLKKVELPDDKIKEQPSKIGISAFVGCESLTELTLHNNYEYGYCDKSLYTYQYGCLYTGYNREEFPFSVETFQGCKGLDKLILDECVTTIEDMFGPEFSREASEYKPLNVNYIKLGGVGEVKTNIAANTLDFYNEIAWYNCSSSIQDAGRIENNEQEILIAGKPVEENLNSEIAIPEGVTVINGGKMEFPNATKITLPSTVTRINYRAFDNCPKLKEINIPSSVEYIDGAAFYETEIYNAHPDGLIYLDNWLICSKGKLEGEIKIKEGTEYMATHDDIRIDAEGNNISGGIFTAHKGITKVTMPNGLKNISKHAFGSCTGLTSIEIPASVTSIGYGAFEDCTGLTSITIPNSVTSIGDGAFNYCTGLKTVKINCENIEGWFRSNGYIENVILGESVKHIKSYAFNYCTSLANITLPQGLETIEEKAFTNTAWYNNQPDGLLYLGNWLIGYKGGIGSKVVIDESTKAVAQKAFSGTSISDVYVSSATPAKIDNTVFSNLSNATLHVAIGKADIETYRAADVWKNFGTFFQDHEANGIQYILENPEENLLTINKYNGTDEELSLASSININGETYSVTSIQPNVFENLKGVSRIDLPEGITTIGSGAFKNCTANTYYIPGSVTTIDSEAFYKTGTTAMTIYVNSTTPPAIESNTFHNRNLQTKYTVYVPAGSAEAYKAANNWSKCKKIIEMDFTGIENITPDGKESNTIYDLNGRVVENPTKGIYIVNGKKVIF